MSSGFLGVKNPWKRRRARERDHTKYRLYLRYGLKFNKDEFGRLTALTRRLIKEGLKPIISQGRRGVFDIPWNGVTLRLVMDQKKYPVTALPFSKGTFKGICWLCGWPGGHGAARCQREEDSLAE